MKVNTAVGFTLAGVSLRLLCGNPRSPWRQRLPKVNGLEVLKEIRSDSQLKLIPVVALTSSREERDLIESYNHGVNAYVVKPVDFQQFVAAVRQLSVFWVLVNEPPPGTARK